MTDSREGIVVTSPDPTLNVRELVDAEVRRLNDLQAANSRRIDELRQAETFRVNREADLRSVYDEKLRAAEANRLDANRAVDQQAVGTANERAVAQAGVLATQVVTSAEALRVAFAATTSQLAESIAALQRSSYEGAGRSTMADPAMLKMAAALELMQASMSSQAGKGQGISATMAVILSVLSGLGVIGGLIAVFTTLGAP